MKNTSLGTGALVGALLTAPLLAVMYLGDQLAGLPFVPFDLFDWMTRVLPGPVITFGIETMINTLTRLGIDVADTAKLAEHAMAVVQFFLGGVLAGAVFYAVTKARQTRPDWMVSLVTGALYGLPQIAISLVAGGAGLHPLINLVWLLALFLGWGTAFNWAYARLEWARPKLGAVQAGEDRSVQAIDRRQFLVLLGTSAATITVVGSGLAAVLARAERRRGEQALQDTVAHSTSGEGRPPFPNANDPLSPAPGTRPEYTPLKDFYKVFIRSEPTVIDGSSWVLPITGLVDNPLMLTLDDLRQRYPRRDQYVTISCISGRVGTTLISTTLWSGASLKEVLAEARVQGAARYLNIASGDGFYETIPLELIETDERLMLCYDWDGYPLPSDHGYPLRVWIPDRYGMKQPKWITAMEVTDQYKQGFWVERGWDELAQVKATSVIDTVAVDAVIQDGERRLVPVGGIAFAGARQISKVELRVDGGPWEAAQLRAPLSETTWVIWHYEWPFQEGRHIFEVRCAEGDGTPQIETTSESHPSGATGIHRKEANL